jgi:hypothetical protein
MLLCLKTSVLLAKMNASPQALTKCTLRSAPSSIIRQEKHICTSLRGVPVLIDRLRGELFETSEQRNRFPKAKSPQTKIGERMNRPKSFR